MNHLPFVFVALIAASPAFAQARIGAAESASGSVSGSIGGRSSVISSGSAVFQRQIIETAAASEAGLRFNDATTLSVGPSARVTLDSFVYNPDGGARSAAMTMARGGFRFVTGTSKPSAFKLQSAHMTLGIRGTDFTVDVSADATDVRLNRGDIRVCTRRGTRECAVLDIPGQAIRVTFAGISVLPALATTPAVVPTLGIGKGKGKAPF